MSSQGDGSAIVGLHSYHGIHVAHTSYINFLRNTFGFEHPIFILHCVLYKHSPYLKQRVETYLTIRRELKLKGTRDSLAKADFYKLLLNGVYGFTLARINSERSPYSVQVVRSSRRIYSMQHNEDTLQVTSLGPKHFLVRKRMFDPCKSRVSPLVCVGAAILAHSKVILMDCLGFLLRYLDPRMAEFVYCDTDSVFLMLHHKQLADNVSPSLRTEFEALLPNFVDSPDRLSGFLVKEKEASTLIVLGEKMYTFGTHQKVFGTRMRGVQGSLLRHITLSDVEDLTQPNAVLVCVSNTFKRSNDGNVSMETSVKRFRNALLPRKRVFHGQHSFPWTCPN